MPLFDTRTPEQLAHEEWERTHAPKPAAPPPLTAVGVYWAVFFALLTFSLLSGVVLFFIRLTSTP